MQNKVDEFVESVFHPISDHVSDEYLFEREHYKILIKQAILSGVLCVPNQMDEVFNIKELKKEWEDHFYESAWEPDTLNVTEVEKKIIEELGTFLPRHMIVYDWNLPFADKIILIVRRHLAKALNTAQTKKQTE